MENTNSKQISDVFRQFLIDSIQPKADTNLSEDIVNERKLSFFCLNSIGFPLTREDIHPDDLLHSDDVEKKKEGLHRQFLLGQFLNQQVPPSTIIDLDRRAANMTTDGSSVVDAYKMILQFSEQIDDSYNQEAEAKSKEIHAKLEQTVTKTNPFTNEKETVTEPSELSKNYFKYKQPYIDAQVRRGIEMEKGMDTNTDNLDLWTREGDTATKEQEETALQQFISYGYKNEYETLVNTLADLYDKCFVNMKKEFKDAMESAKRSDTVSGAEYYDTELYPTDFVVNDTSWTHFAFDSKNYVGDKEGESHGGGFGTSLSGEALLFLQPLAATASIGGGFDKMSGTSSENIDATDLYISFKIARVNIIRPWFKPSIFVMKNYKLSDQAPQSIISRGLIDGVPSLEGILPYYPTELVLIKDVQIRCKDLKKTDSVIKKSVSGHAGISFLGIHIGGHGSKSKYSEKVNIDQEQGLLTIDGMQAIGFMISVTPESPKSVIEADNK